MHESKSLAVIRWPLTLTYIGLWAERVTQAFWPLWSVALVALGLLMLGVQDHLPIEAFWLFVISFLLAGIAGLWVGLRRFRWPRWQDAFTRLDATLKGRPLQSLRDTQAIGGQDAASVAVWQAHQLRMAKRLTDARAVGADLRISHRDPFALRYLALLVLAVAVLFGSFWRVNSVADMASGSVANAGGPTWEGWVEPPAYTGLPSLYLADLTTPDLELVEGSRVSIRLYGAVGDLTVSETVSARIENLPSAAEASQSFVVARPGELTIDGPGGRSWKITLAKDSVPSILARGEITTAARGEMSLPFEASDDYGVRAGQAVIALDLGAVDRRFGLAATPEPRAQITLPLPLPISGARTRFSETFVENFSEHPWAHLPVTITLGVVDELGQSSAPHVLKAPLPGRRFFDPLAGALIDQRRALLWSRQNASDVVMVLRAVTHRPEDVFRSAAAYLRMRAIQRRLEGHTQAGLSEAQRDELAAAMWDLAVLLEEGDLSDALERLRQAQERLAEAMKNGASDQEIAELMQDLRDATQDYLRQLAQQQRENGEEGPETAQNPEDMMQMTQDDLQRMMDRIQELMEQGRMAEAEQALADLQQLLENMQITQGQQGQGQSSPGQEALDGLAETLREQQGLSDQAFRDLQEQFNPGANQGQSTENQGRDGQQGQGQEHQPGEGRGSGNTQGEASREGLAERQEALRRELERQRGTLPGQGTEAGRQAREALDNADRAMDGAEQALRENDLPEAIDRQSEAMEALREGMRDLGRAIAEEQGERDGQGDTAGANQGNRVDPLGRDQGNSGRFSSDAELLQGEDVYRRAREILDEIRRRSGDTARPKIERNYLERLLDRF